MNKANNARSQQTRKEIQESLCILLEQHSAKHITVSLLCQQAGINRSTFYAHYKSLPEIFADIGNTIDQKLLAAVWESPNTPLDQKFALLLEQIRKQSAFFRVWLSMPECEPKLQFLTKQIIEPLTSRLPYKEYKADYYEQGILSILRLWLNQGLKETPQEIALILTERLP